MSVTVSIRVESSRFASFVRSFVRFVLLNLQPRARPGALALKPSRRPSRPCAVVVSIARTARGFTLRALREHDAALGHRFRGRHLDEHAAAARGDRLVLGRNLERGGRARGRGRRATRAGDATRGDGNRNSVRLRRGDHVVDVSRRCVRHEVGEGWMMTCRGSDAARTTPRTTRDERWSRRGRTRGEIGKMCRESQNGIEVGRRR